VLLFNHMICESENKFNKDNVREVLKTHTISHPTDSHPSLFERLCYLQVSLDEIFDRLYLTEDKDAIALIEDIEKIEENLSLAEQQIYREASQLAD